MVMMSTRETRARAAELPCLADPDLFFAESPADIARAKELCRGCPAIRACLTGALERAEPWGVWGGELILRGEVIASKRGRGRPKGSTNRSRRPLPGSGKACQEATMHTHITRGLAAISRFTHAMLRALGRFGSALAEFQRQQDRLAAARLSYDAHMINSAMPPETYDEFLLRTSGPLRREPSARARLAGHGMN